MLWGIISAAIDGKKCAMMIGASLNKIKRQNQHLLSFLMVTIGSIWIVNINQIPK
jgi:Kef-type K+ transport system membrane component KefB